MEDCSVGLDAVGHVTERRTVDGEGAAVGALPVCFLFEEDE